MGAKLEARDYQGDTALIVAANEGHVESVEVITIFEGVMKPSE